MANVPANVSTPGRDHAPAAEAWHDDAGVTRVRSHDLVDFGPSAVVPVQQGAAHARRPGHFFAVFTVWPFFSNWRVSELGGGHALIARTMPRRDYEQLALAQPARALRSRPSAAWDCAGPTITPTSKPAVTNTPALAPARRI